MFQWCTTWIHVSERYALVMHHWQDNIMLSLKQDWPGNDAQHQKWLIVSFPKCDDRYKTTSITYISFERLLAIHSIEMPGYAI